MNVSQNEEESINVSQNEEETTIANQNEEEESMNDYYKIQMNLTNNMELQNDNLKALDLIEYEYIIEDSSSPIKLTSPSHLINKFLEEKSTNASKSEDESMIANKNEEEKVKIINTKQNEEEKVSINSCQNEEESINNQIGEESIKQ